MSSSLCNLMKDSISVRLLRYEIPYQTFMLGVLMHMSGDYRITGDYESGRGYHDIRMERITGSGPNIVMELKTKKTSASQALAEKALKHIHDKDYTSGLKGDTLLYGISFRDKASVIVSERVILRGLRNLVYIRTLH